MVKSTCFQHTSSHPDKYNNSVDRIISKEEEREDPRRDTSVFFEYSGVSTNNTSYKIFFEYSVFYENYSVSTRNPATPKFPQLILCTELILPQEIPQLQGSSRVIPCRSVQGIFQQLFPMHPSILHGRIRLPAPLQHSRPTQYKQASS